MIAGSAPDERKRGGHRLPGARPTSEKTDRRPRDAAASLAQFCVSGFSVVHRKPVQFAGLK